METNKKIEKKYILTSETEKINGTILYRIVAIRDFGDVKKGDLGGWIEKEENLSHDGDCWVYDEAMVWGNARIFDNAKVKEFSWVFESAQVYSHAQLCGHAFIFGHAEVYGCSCILGDAQIFGHARILGKTKICEFATICDNAKIFGNVQVGGDAEIYGDAIVENDSDFIVFKDTWSSGICFTYTKSNKMWKVGCFYGTGEELIKKAYQDSELSGKMYEKYVRFAESLE